MRPTSVKTLTPDSILVHEKQTWRERLVITQRHVVQVSDKRLHRLRVEVRAHPIPSELGFVHHPVFGDQPTEQDPEIILDIQAVSPENHLLRGMKPHATAPPQRLAHVDVLVELPGRCCLVLVAFVPEEPARRLPESP